MWKNKATALFNSLRKEKEKNSLSVEKRSCREYKIKKKVQFAACQIVLESMLPFYTKTGNYSTFFFNCAPNRKRGRWKRQKEREREVKR